VNNHNIGDFMDVINIVEDFVFINIFDLVEMRLNQTSIKKIVTTHLKESFKKNVAKQMDATGLLVK